MAHKELGLHNALGTEREMRSGGNRRVPQGLRTRNCTTARDAIQPEALVLSALRLA